MRPEVHPPPVLIGGRACLPRSAPDPASGSPANAGSAHPRRIWTLRERERVSIRTSQRTTTSPPRRPARGIQGHLRLPRWALGPREPWTRVRAREHATRGPRKGAVPGAFPTRAVRNQAVVIKLGATRIPRVGPFCLTPSSAQGDRKPSRAARGGSWPSLFCGLGPTRSTSQGCLSRGSRSYSTGSTRAFTSVAPRTGCWRACSCSSVAVHV